MPSQTAVFRERVRDHLRRASYAVAAGTPVGDAVRGMAAADASSILVTAAGGELIGIVTERDVVRRVAFETEATTPVDAVMTAPVDTICDDDLLYRAIAFMRRRGLRHMPVVDGDGRVVGLFELHDALARAAPRLVGEIDCLAHEGTRAGLARAKEAQAFVARQMLEDAVPAPDILALISDINADLHRRVVDIALAEMAEAGHGAPPRPFAVIVMGSAGREESGLTADQDNGFVIADYPDEEHAAIDGYFLALAERMTAMLDEAGLPLCRGAVMATNPLWRKTLTQWREQVALWLRRRNDSIVRLGDIFFDFRAACGDAALAEELRATVTQGLKGHFPFLQIMQSVQEDHHVALGLFGRLRTERSGQGRGTVNLKYGALLPLVEGVRLLALREGIAATGTLARIAALEAAGTLSADDRDELAGGFAHITELVLRAQIGDLAAGRAPGYHLAPKDLSRRERALLVGAMKAIRALRGRVRADLTGAVL